MSDKLIEFEEDNYDWLIEKFIKIRTIQTQWEDFVYSEWGKTLQEPDDMADRGLLF